MLISLLAVVLLAPFWLDPVTLGQLRGTTPLPGATPGQSAVATTEQHPQSSDEPINWQPVAEDGFAIQSSQGWGRAAMGGEWQLGGTSSSAVTPAGVAVVVLGDGESGHAILSEVWAHDTEISFTTFTDPHPAPSGLVVSALLRRATTGAAYIVELRAGGEGELAIVVATTVDGTAGQALDVPAVVSGVTSQAGSVFHVRASAVGIDPTQINVRVWPGDAAEPDFWHVSLIDWTGLLQGSGAAGLGWQLDQPGAASGSVTLSFDDVLVREANPEPGK